MMKHRKQNPVKVTSQVRELGSRQSFLDVLRDACAHDGRYTLTAESDGQMFTVLVDRGGPFNAIGGGTAGSPALVAAAQLRTGRCTVSIGWPVDQPLYQPGLDRTLRALVDGAVEPSTLPQHRGVDSLRNAEWREVGRADVRPAASTPAPEFAAAPPLTPVGFQRPSAPSAPQPLAVPAPQFPTRPWVHPESNAAPAVSAPIDEVHSASEGAVAVGVKTAKHVATNALLWLCEVDERKDYTFQEAASLARQSLVEGLAQTLHPFHRGMDSQLQRIKKDWAQSGQVAARSTRKQRARPAAANPDSEFRLL
jgi:hypothetical protein